ncbi:MAG TPA: DNA replication and repair protein RecF [Syntrophomonas sp.]|nr:DNA replication and repair protein RecF [Syntrophomonas sp.]HRW12243.1 DNA replication and repair protein RecF [Syntrophomonas sp.]
MRISQLSINNFRNLKNINFTPDQAINIFCGTNAQGKTNLLEAIYVLSAGSSFRASNDRQLINYDAERYQILAAYNYQERELTSSLSYINNSKIFTINHKKTSTHNQHRLKVVLFNPDDLFLIKGSPAKRRALIDFLLQQLSAEYTTALANYVKILKKRNLMLKKEQTSQQSFAIIDQLFIESAVNVILQRINFINRLDEEASFLFKEINDAGNQLKLRYALSFPVESDKINLNILSGALLAHIKNIFPEENKRRQSLTGPHVDDINFYLDNRPARIYASQGQQRNIVICLKLAEMYTFKRIKGYFPVFLLDEVLAELDEEKRNRLLEYLQKAEFQSFLSSVNFNPPDDFKASLYTIANGELLGKE